jgi:hypothetical protein
VGGGGGVYEEFGRLDMTEGVVSYWLGGGRFGAGREVG